MTTLTMNALNASAHRAASQFRKPSYAELRAALPDMPTEGSLMANATAIATRFSLAAVPFVALGWLFFAR